MPGSIQLLYPQRERCRTCRRYFGFTVISGLYCSRVCAGLPPDSNPVVPFPEDEDPASLPRECRNTGWRGAKPKVRYATLADAQEVVAEMNRASAEAYVCGHCGYAHIGHGRYQP
jgi:hypothetical protein